MEKAYAVARSYFKRVFNIPLPPGFQFPDDATVSVAVKNDSNLQKPLNEIIWSYESIVSYYLKDDKDFKIAGGFFVAIKLLFYIVSYIIGMKRQPGFNTPYRVAVYTNLSFLIVFNLFSFIGAIIESTKNNDAYWWCSVVLTFYPLVILIVMFIFYFPGSKNQNKRKARFGGERFCCLPINQRSCSCFLPIDEIIERKKTRREQAKTKEKTVISESQECSTTDFVTTPLSDEIVDLEAENQVINNNSSVNSLSLSRKQDNIKRRECFLNKTAPLFAYRQFLTAILWFVFTILSVVFCILCTKYTIPPTMKDAYDCFSAIFGINLFYQMIGFFTAIIELIMLFVLIFIKSRIDNDASEIKENFIKELKNKEKEDDMNQDDYIKAALTMRNKLDDDFV